MPIDRRRALMSLLFGPGAIGLRALVSGLPAALLLAADAGRPDKVLRAAQAPSGRSPQFVLFSTSPFGDPINCNAPGTYDEPSITHPTDPAMAATSLNLGGTAVNAAKAWSALPASMLGQTSFFHHATYTVIPPDVTKVLHSQGATRSGEMLPSVLSKNLAALLGTLRQQPVDFNNIAYGPITCDGVLQPTLSPVSLASMLASPGGGLGDANMVALRDKTVDAVHALLRRSGQPFQTALLDEFAQSRTQVRALQDTVVTQLQSIRDNGPLGRMQAAVVLFKMRVTPVVMTTFDFGGDNHQDAGLQGEAKAHQSALTTLAQLPALVDAAGLTGQVTFCSLNVFGRSLSAPDRSGRQHNDQHSVSLISGANVRGGVVGGVAAPGSKSPYSARSIVSATGVADDGGDVAYADTLASFGKTMLAGCGIDNAAADNALRTGTIVSGALRA